MSDDQAILVSVTEAGRLLGIGRGSMYELVRTGEIRSLRIGRLIRIPRSALEEWIERASTSASEAP